MQPNSAPSTPKSQSLGMPGIVMPPSGTSAFGPMMTSGAVNPPPVILAPSKTMLPLYCSILGKACKHETCPHIYNPTFDYCMC